MQDTGLYYYGARFYDPTLDRFINSDPAMDGLNWWIYVRNNPLKYVDPDGLAPGDPFATPDDAAVDFAITFNGQSIREKVEYGASIYIVVDEEGSFLYYTYTRPNRGTSRGVEPSLPASGEDIVAAIHTHANFDPGLGRSNTGFSQNDKLASPGHCEYVVTPVGAILRRTYEAVTVTISDDRIPSDPRIDNWQGHPRYARQTHTNPSDTRRSRDYVNYLPRWHHLIDWVSYRVWR